jgi:hypothetical protein
MRTGYRLAVAVAGITVVIAIVLFVAEALGSTRDASRYGQVPLPGRESLTLPAGDVIIYYGRRASAGDEPLQVPFNLRLIVRTASGQSLVGSTPYRFGQFDDGDYVRRSVAKLRVPEAGNYEAVSPTRVPGATGPVLSFGRDSTRDFGYALFVLAAGLLLAAILAVATRLVRRF